MQTAFSGSRRTIQNKKDKNPLEIKVEIIVDLAEYEVCRVSNKEELDEFFLSYSWEIRHRDPRICDLYKQWKDEIDHGRTIIVVEATSGPDPLEQLLLEHPHLISHSIKKTKHLKLMSIP